LLLANAILVPSGDHAGTLKNVGLAVGPTSVTRSPPDELIVSIERALVWKAMRPFPPGNAADAGAAATRAIVTAPASRGRIRTIAILLDPERCGKPQWCVRAPPWNRDAVLARHSRTP
jgi:hypothetical protein